MDKDILNTVIAELTVAYMAAGRSCSEENLNVVAQSLVGSTPFATAEEVHEAFRRSKEVQDIPTQRTLSEALRNHRAETTPEPSTAPQIEYRNPREAWLPSDTLHRRINLNTAIRNYCAAVSDSIYKEYCKVHARVKDSVGRWTFGNPDRVETFEAPIKETLRDIYRKYWRKCVCAAGYPENAPYNLGLTPPTVREFKAMLVHEQHS